MQDNGKHDGSGNPAPLMTLGELAKYLKLNVGSIYHMLPRITAADGKTKVGRVWRFDAGVVVARVRAGLFGRGLDEEGNPMKETLGDGER